MNHDLHTGRPERRPVGTIAFPDGADFAPEMTPAQVGAYSTLALAHIGDGVYELMMRTALCAAGLTAVTDLHRETVRRVNAPAQARVAEAIQPALTDEERAVYKRGRNAHVHQIPKNATREQYAKATGLECLFGALYLAGRVERLNELFFATMEEPHAL